MSDPNLTTFQGRRCTRVRRQAGTAAPAVNSISTTSTSTSTSTSSSTSTSASVKPDVLTTTPTSLATASSPPTPIPPPPPPDSETNTNMPLSVNRSIVPPGDGTGTLATQTTPKATTATPTNDTTQTPDISLKPVVTDTPSLSLSKNTSSPKPAVLPPSSTGSGSTIVPIPVPVPIPPPAPSNPSNPNAAPSPNQPNAPAQATNPTPNSPKTVATAPGPVGQQPAISDPGNPAAAPQGGNTQQTPQAITLASPVATAGPGIIPAQSPAANQPGQLQPNQGGQPIIAQPVPIAQSNGFPQAGANPLPTVSESVAPGHFTTGKPIVTTSVIVSTNKAGMATSRTSTFTFTPTIAHLGPDHTDGAGSGAGHSSDGHHDSKKVDAGTVVGAVAGVISFAVIAALIFFCSRRARRRRNRGSGTPLLVNRSGGLGSKISISEKFAGVFARRGSAEKETTARSTTPALERGIRDESSSIYSNGNRNRSSSVPVTAFRDRALGILKGRRSRSPPGAGVENQEVTSTRNVPPRIPTPIAQHRRSASSVSSIIQSWSATDEYNNPFRDPASRQPLGIVNPDLTRSNTSKTIQQLPPILIPKPLSPLPKSPVGPPPMRSPGVITAAAAIIPTVAIPQKPRHKRSFSQNRIQNPFLDPEPSASSPRSPHLSEEVIPPEPLAFRRHSRNNTFSPGRPLQHQPSKSSVDSGFVSAKSPLEEQVEKGPGFRGDSDPLRQWHLSTVFSSRDGSSSLRTSDSDESPFNDSNRISKLSFSSGPENLSSSPGPTRPVTSAYPSYLIDRTSRASDPFDLDRPEILAMMKPHWTLASRDTSLSRSGSNRSDRSRANTVTPVPPLNNSGKRKSTTTNWFLNPQNT